MHALMCPINLSYVLTTHDHVERLTQGSLSQQMAQTAKCDGQHTAVTSNGKLSQVSLHSQADLELIINPPASDSLVLVVQV